LLTNWKFAENSPVEFRASLTLDLTGEDAVKAERFTESDEDTARLWWLHCNLTGETPDTSWTAFTEMVRPLIRIADENDPVTRLARALLTMNDYFRADPDRLNDLADFTAFAAQKMGDDEIATALARLRQPAPPSQSGTNGAIPPAPDVRRFAN
jgi:hypothetical protein